MNINPLYAIIFAVAVMITAVSQALLKKEAMLAHDTVLGEYLNVRVILAYAMFFLSTLMAILAYRGIPLSLGPILETTGYIYITIFGVRFFGEHINKGKMTGLLLIVAGIVVYSLG